MKAKIGEQLLADYADAHAQILKCKRAAHTLFNNSEALREDLGALEDGVRALQAKTFYQRDGRLLDELNKLERRIERLRELRNMMELGSWSITIDRVMQMIHEKLP